MLFRRLRYAVDATMLFDIIYIDYAAISFSVAFHIAMPFCYAYRFP